MFRGLIKLTIHMIIKWGIKLIVIKTFKRIVNLLIKRFTIIVTIIETLIVALISHYLLTESLNFEFKLIYLFTDVSKHKQKVNIKIGLFF